MGLLKLSGDPYDYIEDAKLAAGIETQDANVPAPNPIKDRLPSTIDAQTPPNNVGALKQPTSNVPKAPIPAPNQDIYSADQKSLPPLPPNTRYASYEGSSMSKLRDLLNSKTAMTQTDLETEYAELPTGDLQEEDLFPVLNRDSSVQHYKVPSDYSNYLSAKVPSQQESFDVEDLTEAPGQALPETYVEPQAYATPQESMGYNPYQAYANYESMGYDPYQAYANYEQMYATPTEEIQPEYQEIQTEQAPVQENTAQQAYQQSFNEIYTYLLQMGYSPEEAQAAVPSLLEQVNVYAPQEATKTASAVFNSRANQLKAEYIDAGYSPFQAREMSLEIVIPVAEKYASMSYRIGGGLAGSIGGGLLAHSQYDKGEDTGALLGGAVLGGGLGAFGLGRGHKWLKKNNLTKGFVQSKIDDLSVAERQVLKDQISDAASAFNINKKDLSDVANYEALVNKLVNVHRVPYANVNNQLLDNQRSKVIKELFHLKQVNFDDLKNMTDVQKEVLNPYLQEAARAARSTDLKRLGAGAVVGATPIYFLDRALRGTGKDNLVDSGIDSASTGAQSLGTALSSGGREALNFIKENPGLTAAVTTGAVATPYVVSKIKERRAQKAKAKGGRTKKAQLENGLEATFEKEAMRGAIKKIFSKAVPAVEEGVTATTAPRALGYAGLGAVGSAAGATAGLTEEEIERMGGRTVLRSAAALRGGLLGGLGARLGGARGGLIGSGLASAPGALEAATEYIPGIDFSGLAQVGRAFAGTQEGGYLDRVGQYYANASQRAREERLQALKDRIQSTLDAREKQELEAKLDKEFAAEESRLQRLLSGLNSNNKSKGGGVMDYITENPGKSALIGAGTAAGLYGLYSLASGGGAAPAGSNVERLRQHQQQQLLKRRR